MQEQSYKPTLFVQNAFPLQISVLSSHSSTSAKQERGVHTFIGLIKQIFISDLSAEGIFRFKLNKQMKQISQMKKTNKNKKKTLMYESPLAGSRPAPEFRSGSEKLNSLPSVRAEKY